MTATITPLVGTPKPGIRTTEFWTHTFTLIVAAAAFVLSVVHPGFKVPSAVEAGVAPASIVAGLISQLAYIVSRHGLKKSTLAAVAAWGQSALPDVVTAVEDIKPIVATVPSLSTRLSVIEGGLAQVGAVVPVATVAPVASVVPVAPVEPTPAPVAPIVPLGPIQAALAAANASDLPPAA